MTRADVEDQQRRQRRAEGRPEEPLPPPREHAKSWGDGSAPPKGGSGADRCATPGASDPDTLN